MAYAMNYEYLLRRIYQVGRFGKPDINADIYRELERAERSYTLDVDNKENEKPRLSAKSIDDLSYEYSVQCGRVWHIIQKAIKEGLSKNRGVFSVDEVKAMEAVIKEPKIVTKEHLDNAIDTVEKIYISHEIYPVQIRCICT